jgi:pimeloyl-ACP methyl ester carboxylesterase
VAAAVRLQTHVWGVDGDRRALLLHGLCSDGATWWRLASELADEGWLVVAPDLRGHGRSPAGAAYDLESLAADAAVLGSGWDVVVGHSLGGAIAAHLLADPGLEIRAGVLVDPVLRAGGLVVEQIRQALRAEAGGVEADDIRRVHPDWDERDVWRKVMATRLVTPDVVDAVLADNDPWDVVPLVERWRARVHLLAADPTIGGTLPPSLAEEVSVAAHVSFEVVAGAGHSIHREAPASVRAAVDLVTSDA